MRLGDDRLGMNDHPIMAIDKPMDTKLPVSPIVNADDSMNEGSGDDAKEAASSGTLKEEKGLSQEETREEGVGVSGGCSTDEDEEGRKAITRRPVVGPTKQEREEHEATHCQHRS